MELAYMLHKYIGLYYVYYMTKKKNKRLDINPLHNKIKFNLIFQGVLSFLFVSLYVLYIYIRLKFL